MNEGAAKTSSASNDNVMAAVATLPVVGLIMYFGMKDLSPLAKFYAKQSIGTLALSVLIMVVSMVIGIIPVLGLLACLLFPLSIVPFILWIVQLIYALQGKEFRTPVLSDLLDQYVK